MKRETTVVKYLCDVCGAEHIPVADKVTFSISKYSPWVCDPHGCGGNLKSNYEDLCLSCNEQFTKALTELMEKIKNKKTFPPTTGTTALRFTDSGGAVIGEINSTGSVVILGPNKEEVSQ
jgi:hypothetical protein